MADNLPALTEEPKADIARLKRMFAESRTLTATARQEQMTDCDYYDSKQFTSSEKQTLADRGQPDIVINRIKPAINGMVGVIVQSKSQPRAHARGPDDEESADVASDVLTYVSEFNRFPRIKQDCFLDMLVPGTMAALVGVNQDSQVEITQIRWQEFFGDPRSQRKDFKDARYLGIAKWMYQDDVAALYPAKRTAIEATIEAGPLGAFAGGFDSTLQDRPINGMAGVSWVDRRQRRLMVVEIYYREGEWRRCVFTGSDVLEEGPSPYTDHKGRPDCPIEAQSAFVDQDNNRYGVVRDMRGPQDEINKRRSKLLHLLSVSQIEVADPSAIDVNADTARAEAARPDGVIPYGWRKVSTVDMATGQALLLAESKAEIERMGPNPAVLGRSGEDQSGRALLARQAAGMVELAILFGGLEDWELRIWRQSWARAKQFWTAPQFVRVTDDRDASRFVGINQPQMGPARLVQDPATGQTALQPTVLGYKNQLAEMDVDISLDVIQDMGTVRHEQFDGLMKLLASNPMWAAQVPFDVALDLSDIPHKKSVRDRIKQAAEEAAKAKVSAEQIGQTTALLSLKKTQSEVELNEARAHQIEAETLTGVRTDIAAHAIDGLTLGHEHGSIPPPGMDESNGANAA